MLTTTPRKGAGSAHPYEEEKLEELCRVPGALPLPWHEDQPCTLQNIECSGLYNKIQFINRMFSLLWMHKLILVPAAGSEVQGRADHGFPLHLWWCNTHRLWNTDSGDSH